MNLTGYGVKLQGDVHPTDGTDLEGQEIEENGPITLGGERDHLAAVTTFKIVVDPHQIGGLATQSGPVIHDLRVELTQSVIEENH